MIDIGQTSKRVLLTGAGFSRNWGGSLATELWGTLLSDPRIRDSRTLQPLFVEESSFEVAIAKVRAGEFSQSDREAAEAALLDAFVSMDRTISLRQPAGDNRINIYGVQDFLTRFGGRPSNGSQTGYIFTLNQDMLLERQWYNFGLNPIPPTIPGIPRPESHIRSNCHWFSSIMGPFGPDEISHVRWTDAPSLANRFNYIKLHGSFNWRTDADTPTMVIGSDKARQISEHPLLAWYAEVFRAVLNEGDVRLMIVGYSFGDAHINSVIAEAAKIRGLRVYIWDVAFNTVRETLQASSEGRDILAGLMGMSCRPVAEIFPSSQIVTEEYRLIQEQFFNGG